MKDKEVARHWGRNARTWETITNETDDPLRTRFSTPAFVNFLGDIAGFRVLDLGCAAGGSTRLLAEMGASVIGADIAEEMLAIAREKEEEKPQGIGYQNASLTDLSVFDDASFDSVVSLMALMDMMGLDRGAREIFRVLKPGGSLFFSVRHPCFRTAESNLVRTKDKGTRLLLGQYFLGKPRMEKVYTEAAVEPMLVPRFSYTMADYINFTVGAGLRIEKMEEPRPTKATCRTYPYMEFWRRHAALFLFVKAVKP